MEDYYKKKLYDVKGKEIIAFDVIKVYHFTNYRRKKHYMYKLVKKHRKYGLVAYHLGKMSKGESRFYSLVSQADASGKVKDTEIVQENWADRNDW